MVAARCLTAAEFPEPRAVAVEALLPRTLAICEICNVSDGARQRLVINTDRELGFTVPQLSTATLKMYSQHYKKNVNQHTVEAFFALWNQWVPVQALRLRLTNEQAAFAGLT